MKPETYQGVTSTYRVKKLGGAPLGGTYRGAYVRCECGWQYESNAGKRACVSAWKEHVREDCDSENKECEYYGFNML